MKNRRYIMGRKTIIGILLVIIILSTSIISYAVVEGDKAIERPKTLGIILDGEDIVFQNQNPTIIISTAMVPIEFIEEHFNVEVKWNRKKTRVNIIKSFYDGVTKDLEISLGKLNMILRESEVDKEEVSLQRIQLPIVPQLLDDTPMFPIRAIAEVLRYTVGWSEEDYSVLITSPNFLLGEDFPDYTLIDSKGKKVQLLDLVEKPFIVEFMGTWCPYSQRCAPTIKEFVEKYPEIPVVVMALRDDAETVAEFKEKYEANYEIYLPEGEYREALTTYGVKGVPSLFFVDKAGKAQYFSGSRTIEEMEEIMSRFFR